MKKQKIMKWALPALLMSAMTFAIMPGSVRYYVLRDGKIMSQEQLFNFFTLGAEITAAACLPIAGVATFLTLLLALVAACFKKPGLYRTIGWCSLASGALTAVPYMIRSAEEFVQPNVIVILLTMACWLMAMYLDKKKDAKAETADQGPRL